MGGKRKGHSPKSTATTGEISQQNKKVSFDTLMHLSQKDKGSRQGQEASSGNPKGTTFRGKTVPRKEPGAIPKTSQITPEDFLEKNRIPPTPPLSMTQLGMDPFVVKVTQGENSVS